MTSGSNCRHLNRPQTEDARKSILPAYHGVTCKVATLPGSIIRCLRHKTSEDNLKVGKSHRSIGSKVRFALLRRFIAARDARFSTVS